VEDSDDYPACYDPTTFEVTTDPSFGLKFTADLFDTYDLKNNWAYFDAHTNTWFGLNKSNVLAFCSSADIIINISGVNPLRDWWTNIPVRIFIDTDPGFTQIKHLSDPTAYNLSNHHTHHFTFGENVGKKNCTIPIDSFQWKATRQPVFMDAWKVSGSHPSANWTTVMQWDSYKVKEYNNQVFGMKSQSFKKFDLLPNHFPDENFEIAMGSVSAPIEDLKSKGWKIINSLLPTKTPWTYQNFIANSKGEWSVAKHGYIISNSGWFSERTTCYLASGKPVVIENTGFSEVIETGKGIFAFKTIEEAEESIKIINKDYKYHCAQARKQVECYFSADNVLVNLLKDVS
jgi:hypothetical protein